MGQVKECAPWILAATAWALSAAVAWSEPISWRCQSDADHYSAMGSVAHGGIYSINGKVSINAPKLGGRYMPSATARFESQDGSQSSALHIAARMGRRFPMLTVFIITKIGDKSRYTFTKDVDLHDSVDFQFSLSETGKVSLLWNDKTYSADLTPLPMAKLRVSCSSGDFDFANLSITPEGASALMQRASNLPSKD